MAPKKKKSPTASQDGRSWTDGNPTAHLCRNITVNGRRTSVRMETVIWDSLMDIGRREDWSINDLCSVIDRMRGPNGLTAALRVFIVGYFRDAAEGSGLQQTSLAEAGGRNLSQQMRVGLGLLGDLDKI